MLPPVTRMTPETAAEGGSPALPGQGHAAEGENPFSSLLGVARAPADGGSPAGTDLPADGNPVPDTSVRLPGELAMPAAPDTALPELPPGAATADAGEGLPPLVAASAATDLVALERMLPPAADTPPAAPVPAVAMAAVPAGSAAPALPRTPDAGLRRPGAAAAPGAATVPSALAGAAPADAAPPASVLPQPAPGLKPAAPAASGDPAVLIRDAAGRSAVALGDALQSAASRRAVAVEPAAGVEWLRAEPDVASLRALPPMGAGIPVVTATSAATPGAPPPATAAIPLPLADSGWGDALAERVLVLAGQRTQAAELRLNPAELGPLRVEIRLDDGALQVNFTAQHAVTRDAIEQALPRLRELFAAEGLSLTGASVSEQDLRHERDGRAAGDARAAAAVDEPGEEDDVEMTLPRPDRERGLVDTFA